MASSHPAWSHWSDATVLDDYAMTTTTTTTTYGLGFEGSKVRALVLALDFGHDYITGQTMQKWCEFSEGVRLY